MKTLNEKLKEIKKINFNGKHLLSVLSESNVFKMYTKKDKNLINQFIKHYLEFIKALNIIHLKNMISISFNLSIRSALFEQISLILSKRYNSLFNR